MPSIHEIRRKNLLQIVHNRFEGNVAALARACGKAQSLCHGILKDQPIKNLGEKLARDIEAALNLPSGWLDQDGENPTPKGSGLTNEEDLFLLSVKKTLESKQIPAHMMQTVLVLLDSAQSK